LAPTVHVKGCLGKNEGSGIRDGGALVVGSVGGGQLGKAGKAKGGKNSGTVGSVSSVQARASLDTTKVGFRQGVVVNTSVPVASETRGDVLIHGTRILEKTTSINEGIGAGKLAGSTEGVDRVGEGINGISVVEGLGTKDVEEGSTAKEGRTVINVLVGLDNPDKLLHGVVEVELDLVGGGTNRLVTSELKLGDQILVRVLGETAALVRVQEDVVNVQRSRNKGLIVGNGGADGGANGVLVGRVVEVRTGGT